MIGFSRAPIACHASQRGLAAGNKTTAGIGSMVGWEILDSPTAPAWQAAAPTPHHPGALEPTRDLMVRRCLISYPGLQVGAGRGPGKRARPCLLAHPAARIAARAHRRGTERSAGQAEQPQPPPRRPRGVMGELRCQRWPVSATGCRRHRLATDHHVSRRGRKTPPRL